MPLLPLIALAALAPSAFVDRFETFAKNDAAIGKSAFDKPSPQVSSNLDLLVDAIREAAPSEVAQIVAKFDRLAKKNDDGFATSFSWVSGSKVNFEHFTAVAVSYGPIGRVAVFEADYKAKNDVRLAYMVQRSPRILAFNDDGLLVASGFVRDAGMRDNTRIDFAHIRLGRALHSDTVEVSKSFEFEHTLDWGGAAMKNGQLTVDSIDSPKSFFFSESEAHFRRHRSYTFGNHELSLKLDQPGDLELRAADAWIMDARGAANPTPVQRAVRKLVPEPQMVMDYKVTPSSVTLELDGGTLVFQLSRAGGKVTVSRVKVN